MLGFHKGDTIIEVVFAIAAFSFVSVVSIAVMNQSVETAQSTLEVTMARNEIDAQSEAIRFIHNSFLSEREYENAKQVYRDLWKRLSDSNLTGGLSNDSNNVPDLNYSSCSQPYSSSQPNNIAAVHGFILNTRLIDPTNTSNTIVPYSQSVFAEPTLYPRLIYSATGNLNGDQNSDNGVLITGKTTGQKYRTIARVEGIWVVSVAGINATGVYSDIPEYYDFHIRTCWYAPGNNNPSTIGTIIRLYNPELVEIAR